VLALEVAVRLVLILGSAGINLDGHANPWISGIISVASIAATAELAVRPYGSKVLDRLLLAAGSLVVTLLLLGLLLNLLPWGLTRGTWNLTWAVLSILVLVRRRGVLTGIRFPRIPINVLSLSIVAAAAIIAGAAALVASGVHKWEGQPALSFSLAAVSSKTIATEIDATSMSGSYSIVSIVQYSKKAYYTSKPFEVTAGRSGATLRERVPIGGKGRWIIDLEPAGGGKALRELIVNIP
jgi:hypothetical protein